MSVFKRDGSLNWQYKFVINNKPYRGSCGTTNKAEAILFEARQKEQVKDLQAGKRAPREITIGAAAEAWLTEKGERLADAKNNTSRVRKLFGETLTEKGVVKDRYGLSRDQLLHRLCDEDLVKLRSARLREGNADATINREVSLLQSIVRHCRRLYKVPQCEWGEAKEAEGSGRLRFLSLTEEAALIRELNPMREVNGLAPYEQRSALMKAQAQDQLDLVIFLLDTGARYDEVASITWDVIDLAQRRVMAYRSKVDNEGYLPMSDRLYVILMRRMEERKRSIYIFPNRDDPTRPRGHATKGIKKAMKRAGLNEPHLVARYGPCVPAHSLRHTFASRMVEAGLSIYELSKLLGHTSVKTTERYVHLLTGPVADKATGILNNIHAPKLEGNVVNIRG